MQSTEEENCLECGICLERYSENKKPAKLRACEHIFCHVCIDNLIQTKPMFCPMCRCPFTKNDVFQDRNIWSYIKMLLSTLSIQTRNIRPQTRDDFKTLYQPLKPTLRNIIILEKAIINCYEEVISKAQGTQTYNLVSVILKTISAAFCIFPPTVIAGLIANGVLCLADLANDITSNSGKKGAYVKLSDVVIKHDKLSNSPQITALFLDYQTILDNKDQAKTYAGYLNVNEPYMEEASVLSKTNFGIQLLETSQLGLGLYKQSKQILETANNDVTMLRVMEGGAKTSKAGINTLTNGLLVGGVIVQWGLVVYQWKKENDQIQYLKDRIAETRISIRKLERVVELMETQNQNNN